MAPEKEKDPRVPLAVVCFNSPTSIPGISMMMTILTAGERRVVDGKDWYPEALWFNPVTRMIQIEGRSYPLERVHYFERAKAAITKVPPPLDLSKFNVGKRK